MPVLETARLALRQLAPDDADFIVRLLNEPSFLRYIGDRKVRTPADACAAASPIIDRARRDGLRKVLAIASQDNVPSINLLGKLGFRFERAARLYAGEPELNVFVSDL